MPRFDWYQASVAAPLEVLRQGLADLGDGPGHWEAMQRAPHGYAAGERLLDADGQVLALWHGGVHSRPHVVASGESAQQVAQGLRERFPGHWVSRADVCIDYAEAGAYGRLQGLALGVARDRGVRVGTAGDHLLTMRGRTVYLGSPSSHTRLRIYDKAYELRQRFAADPVRLAQVPDELARLEVQVRPQTPAAKAAAARVEPVVLMGSAAWTRELMRQVAALELEPFEAGRPWRQSDDDRAYAALLAQYGGMLSRVCANLGSWDMVGRQIGCDLVERRAARKGKR